jgi:hypothetical protein
MLRFSSSCLGSAPVFAYSSNSSIVQS